MKKLINDRENLLEEMLEGLVKSTPLIKRIEGTGVIYRSDMDEKKKVGIVSGGGSGHEPAHAGFVGYGMLDCAVCGEIFTSPTPDQILAAIKKANRGMGVFLIIKNYTGDVMNFQMAMELAEMEGIKTKSVIVNDDVAVEDSSFTTGRRGIAGTLFFHKILGAMTEDGRSLDEIDEKAQSLLKRVRSMGMAIKPPTNPMIGEESFHLEEDEMEIGIGIHGEPGIRKERLKWADDISKELIDKILLEFDDFEGDFALLVNGLGASPQMELFIINNFCQDYLKEKGMRIYRTYLGNYMTSLDMAGFSLSLVRLDETEKKYLDYRANTLAWKEI